MGQKIHAVIISHETFWEAARVDATTWALAFGLIFPGWLLGSDAMQWAGFFVFIVACFTIATRKAVTVDEARKRLDEIEAGRK